MQFYLEYTSNFYAPAVYFRLYVTQFTKHLDARAFYRLYKATTRKKNSVL